MIHDELVPLSAPTHAALGALAERLARRMQGAAAPSLHDVAFTYEAARHHHAIRRALVASDGAELARACRADDGVTRAPASEHPRVAFVFTGQGSQRPGAVAGLAERFGDFAHTWRRCAELLEPALPCSLDELAAAATDPALLASTELAQPLLFAIGASLADLLRALGVVPELVLGHSLGECVAAYVAGALALEDACRLVAARGRLMAERCAPGAMLVVSQPYARIEPLLADLAGIEPSTELTPTRVVVGGPLPSIEALAQRLERTGFAHRRLAVSHAFHTAMVEPMLEPFAAVTRALPAGPLHTPMILGTTGALVRDALGPDHWVEHARRPVRFARCIETLAEQAPTLVIELGSQLTLAATIAPLVEARVVGTLRRDRSAVRGVLEGLGAAYEVGVQPAWAVLHEGRRPRRVHVPAPPLHAEPIPALPAPVAIAAPAAPIAPALAPVVDPTALREGLRSAWATTLGMPPAHDHEDLLDAGADSLALLQLAALVDRQLRRRIEVVELLEHRTIAALVRHLQAAPAVATTAMTIPSAGDGPWFPLSDAQAAMYLAAQLPWAAARDNLPALVPWEGDLDLSRLRAAFEAVVRRHPALRTTFAVIEGEPRQRIEAEVPWDLEAHEVEEPAALRRLYRELATTPLQLDRSGFRVAAVRHEARWWLVLTAHHLIFDGWSMNLVKRDLLRAYAGEPLDPPPRHRHVDFVAWQQHRLANASADVEFWREELAGVAPSAAPAARRPRHGDAAGATVVRQLSSQVVSRLHALCREESATPFMALLAVYGTALADWAERDETVVGVSVAGRPGDAFDDVVGSFVDVLPIRCGLRSGGGFNEHLRAIRATVLRAFEHRELPFARIVSAAAPVRSGSDVPLISALFAYQNVVENAAEAIVHRRRLGLDAGLAKLDLSLSAIEHEGALWLELEHSSAAFEPEAVGAFLDRFVMLVERAVRAPARPLRELLERTAPRASVGEQLARHAAERPDARAIRGPYPSGDRSWAQLDARVTAKAEQLRSAGLDAGSLVAIDAERTTEVVEWILACLRAEIPYVPLDPRAPPRRIAAQLEALRVDLSISDRTDRGSGSGPTWPSSGDGPRPPLPARASATETASRCAYVMLTSGSTGTPRGVEIGDASLVAYLRWAVETYGMEPGTRVPLFTSLAFDLSVTSLLGAIWAGAELEPFPSAHPLEAVARALVEATEPMLLKLTPSHLAALLELVGTRRIEAELVAVVGGEALDAELVRRWQAVAPRGRVFNEYGPTEATVGCCAHEVSSSPPAGAPLPIDGLQPPGTMLAVVDGELYIGGPQLALGYRHAPELTAERFVTLAGARAYRTGDRVERGPDGRLRYRGRLDDQVKIRGHRVELSELAELVRAIPGVRAAEVVVQGEGREAGLVACVVLDPSVCDAGSLPSRLAEVLPAALTPRVLVLDALPTTERGKADRRRLVELAAPVRTATASAASSDVELRILATWRDVLGGGPFDRTDDFFAVGGHSLALFQILARLKGSLPALTIEHLFLHRTPAALASVLAPTSGSVRRILVTGATGFLGVHVVEQLLRRTTVQRIVCPVRSRHGASAAARWEQVAARFLDAKTRAQAAARVEVVDGDVTREGLGLPAALERADVVLHCAAVVAHLGDEASIDAVNLDGTRHVHALASRWGARLHHVSSLGALALDADEEGEVPLTEERLPPAPPRGNAYTRSKQAAEAWLCDRGQASVPTTIHRVGNLVGRTRDGRFQLDIERSALYRMLKAWLCLALAPDRLPDGGLLDLTPVDFAAEAIVALALAPEPAPARTHVCHPEPIALTTLLNALRERGYPLEVVDRSEYSRRIHRMLLETPLRPGLELAAMHADPSPSPARAPRAWSRPDATATAARLHALGVASPPTPAAVVAAIVAEGVARGYLPRAPRELP